MLTRRIGTAAAALALLALGPATAEAKKGQKSNDDATKACQAQRAELGRTAFAEAFKSLGACVSQRRADVRAAERECRDQRSALGEDAFREEWAAAPTADTASAKPKGKGKKSRKRNRGRRPRAVDAAFARCVAETVKDIADERAAGDDAPEGEDVGEAEKVDEPDDDAVQAAGQDDDDRPGRGRGSQDD